MLRSADKFLDYLNSYLLICKTAIHSVWFYRILWIIFTPTFLFFHIYQNYFVKIGTSHQFIIHSEYFIRLFTKLLHKFKLFLHVHVNKYGHLNLFWWVGRRWNVWCMLKFQFQFVFISYLMCLAVSEIKYGIRNCILNTCTYIIYLFPLGCNRKW